MPKKVKSLINKAPIRGFRVATEQDFRTEAGRFALNLYFWMRPGEYDPNVQGPFTTNKHMDVTYFKRLIEIGAVWIKLG